jgi:hypothetical protein
MVAVTVDVDFQVSDYAGTGRAQTCAAAQTQCVLADSFERSVARKLCIFLLNYGARVAPPLYRRVHMHHNNHQIFVRGQIS